MKSLTDLRVVLVIHKKLCLFCSNSEIQKLLGYSMTELKIFHLFILSIYTTLLKLLLKAVCWTLVSCEPTDGVDDQKSTQYLSGWNSKRLRFCVSQGTRICEKKNQHLSLFFILCTFQEIYWETDRVFWTGLFSQNSKAV